MRSVGTRALAATSYLSRSLLIAALLGAGFAISSAVRMRSEETALHAEPVLATSVSRNRRIASQLAVTLAGSVVVLAAAGLGAGLTYGLAAHDLGQVPRLVGVALAYVPAVWLAPRLVAVPWGVLAACFVVGMLTEVLDLPTWVTNLSPFQHTPAVPTADLTLIPLAVQATVAAALICAGFADFRYRDVA